MNFKLVAVAVGFALPITAQFVDAVRNNQVQANYVSTYSTWPQDQVTQSQFNDPVIKPNAAANSSSAALLLQQPYRPQQYMVPQPDVQASGLPLRARQALETAAADDSGTAVTTDASGAPRFSTTVTAQPILKETRRSENIMGPLNRALFNTLMTVYSMDSPRSHTGRK